VRTLASLAALLFAAGAFAQGYPAKPVRVIVPFPPGGSADAASRSMAEKLATLWGQPVVLEHKPGALNYASSGNGASPHLAAEMFARAAGIRIVHVPFKGMAPALLALVSGEVDLTFADVAVMPQVRSGRLKALAVTTARESPLVPGVPTLAEAGVAGVDIPSVAGFIAPAGTPRDTIAFINASMSKALAAGDLRERLIGLGLEPYASTPEEFGAFIASEVHRYAQVIRDAGIKVD
jgi:tripartite-type tricarboxylate transporter receptor subunit TctC